MGHRETHMVTGAFSYTGRHITQRLLSMGERVKTLTEHPQNNPFGERVESFPLNFKNRSELAANMREVTTFYNTYWIRFPHGQVTFEQAVENSKELIRTSREAGVRRFVHISITNAAKAHNLPYFRGKALIEEALMESGLSYAIIRPTIVFGPGDILINNIAWMLRRFPIFAMIGSGNYRVQPVFVEDVSEIAVDAGKKEANMIIDAVGPEIFTFEELVKLIRRKINSRTQVIHMSPWVTFLLSKIVGYLVRDVVLTWDEIKGLTSNLLVTESLSSCQTRLSEWLRQNAGTVGIRYASELKRHYE